MDAGADARWRNHENLSAIENACHKGQLSIVEILLNHDNGLLETPGFMGLTPMLVAIGCWRFEIAHFLLDRGANILATNEDGLTALMLASCQEGANMESVRWLLSAGFSVEARDTFQCTALHYAASWGNMETMRAFIVQHNANMVARDINDETPFDFATSSNSAGETHALLIETYGNKLTQEYGRLALHAVLTAAEYSFAINDDFHPPLNPLRIRLPLGMLTLQHFRSLVSALDVELIRNRDGSGMLPIHIACLDNAPFEVLSMLVEMDTATLQIANYSGALPMHLLLVYSVPSTEYASVRYLVEQGGVGTLAARNRHGALPLHVLCRSTFPSLRIVQYLIQSLPGSVAAQTNTGQYPFIIAACKSSTASLSVVYELVRSNLIVVIPSK